MAKRPRSAAASGAAAGEDSSNKAAKHQEQAAGAGAGAGAGSSSSSAAAAGGAPKFAVNLDKQITFNFSDGPVSFLPRMFEPFEDCLVMTMCASELNAGRTSFDFKDRQCALFKSLVALAKAGAAKTMIEKPYSMSWADYFEELEYWQVSQPLPHGLSKATEDAVVACTEALVADLIPVTTKLRQEILAGLRGPATVRIPMYSDRIVALAGRLYDAATKKLAELPAAAGDAHSPVAGAAGAGGGAGAGAAATGPRQDCSFWLNAVAVNDDSERVILTSLIDAVNPPLKNGPTHTERQFMERLHRACTVVRYTQLLRRSPYTRFHLLKAATEAGAVFELNVDSSPESSVHLTYRASSRLWAYHLQLGDRVVEGDAPPSNVAVNAPAVMGKDEFIYFLGREHTEPRCIFEGRDFTPSEGDDPSAKTFRRAQYYLYGMHIRVDAV